MSNPIYTFTNLQNAVNEKLHGKGSNLIDFTALLNRGVREVISSIDIASQIRQYTIAPGIYGKEYNYYAPTDLKADAICDLRRQVQRHEEFNLVTPEEFDRRKTCDEGIIAIDNLNYVTMLRIASEMNTQEVIVNDCESLTANGTFVASGDATNLSIDNNNFLNGSGSLKFDTLGGSTSAVITNANQDSVDLSKFIGQSLFAYIFVPTGATPTTFTLKWGTDGSNYWSQAVTVTNEGVAFQSGWNLLRFDWISTATKVGTPDSTEIKYIQFTLTESVAMAAQSAWRLDFIVARIGEISNLVYYSKYPWQTTGTYAYKENSTATTDFLVADTDEFDLFTVYCAKIGSQPCRLEKAERDEIDAEWKTVSKNYIKNNPSQRKLLVQTYQRFASIDGDYDVWNSPWNQGHRNNY